MDTTVEASDWVVSGNGTFHINREVGSLRQILGVDSVEELASSWSSLGTISSGLVCICLCDQVPGAGSWVNDTSTGDTHERVDIGTSVEISSQERNGEVLGGHNNTRLRIDLVEVVLGGGDVEVLHAVCGCIYQRHGEQLLLCPIVKSRETGLEDLTKGLTSYDGGVHIMITAEVRRSSIETGLRGFHSRLIPGSGIISSPGDRIGRSQRLDIINEERKEKCNNECGGRHDGRHLDLSSTWRRQREIV